jgi:hypothetical protein
MVSGGVCLNLLLVDIHLTSTMLQRLYNIPRECISKIAIYVDYTLSLRAYLLGTIGNVSVKGENYMLRFEDRNTL